MNSLIEQVTDIALSAAKKIKALAHNQGAVAFKSDRTPVTDVDLAISRYLEEQLPKVLAVPVVSEETPLAPLAERKAWAAYWLIDPLDGTKDFIAGKAGVAVNIALMVEGRPALGVVTGPFVNELFVGWLPLLTRVIALPAAAGAFKKNFDESAWQAIRSALPSKGLRLYRSRDHGSDLDWQLLSEVEIATTLSLGSALKLCRIAEGEADVYVRSGPTGEWDTAAPEAILIAAGGAVVDWGGRPLAYNKQSPLNPPFVAMGPGLVIDEGKLLAKPD